MVFFKWTKPKLLVLPRCFCLSKRLTALIDFKPLKLPANYYDDLAARFDLSGDTITSLQSRNILYDEDPGGVFLQLYSRPFGDGFFFEIVERRDTYCGYGAPNAPYRIAAQKRIMHPAAMPGH